MHEYSLAQALLEGLVEHLHDHPVEGRVRRVHVRQGELLVLSGEALSEAWRILAEGTALDGSELAIERIPVKVRCPTCGYEGPVEYLSEEDWHFAIPVLACPKCGGRTEITAGRDLAIVALTTDEGGEVRSSQHQGKPR